MPSFIERVRNVLRNKLVDPAPQKSAQEVEVGAQRVQAKIDEAYKLGTFATVNYVAEFLEERHTELANHWAHELTVDNDLTAESIDAKFMAVLGEHNALVGVMRDYSNENGLNNTWALPKILDVFTERSLAHKNAAHQIELQWVQDMQPDNHLPREPWAASYEHYDERQRQRVADLLNQRIDTATASPEYMAQHLGALRNDWSMISSTVAGNTFRSEMNEHLAGYQEALANRQNDLPVDPVFRSQALHLEEDLKVRTLSPEMEATYAQSHPGDIVGHPYTAAESPRIETHPGIDTKSRGAALLSQTIDVATAPLEQMQTHLRDLKTELKQGVSASTRLGFYDQILGYSAAIRDRQENRSVDPVFRANVLNLEVLAAKGLLTPEQNVIRREALYHGTVDPQLSAIHEATNIAERATNTEQVIEPAHSETPNRYAYLDAAIEQLTSGSRAATVAEVAHQWTLPQSQQTVFISQQRTQQVAIDTPEVQRDFGVSL